jgi:quercetin dioxygenase-like cupin family protein
MSNTPVHVASRTGPAYWVMGCMMRFVVRSEETGGSYTTFEATVPPDEGANPHLHADKEEQFYVIEGELTFEVDGQTIEVGTGDVIHVPRGVVHSFRNGGRQAKLLSTFVPGTGIDQEFIEMGTLMTPEAAYGSERVQPPPGATRHRVD